MALVMSLPMSRMPFFPPQTATAQTSASSPHCLEFLPHNREFKRLSHTPVSSSVWEGRRRGRVAITSAHPTPLL